MGCLNLDKLRTINKRTIKGIIIAGEHGAPLVDNYDRADYISGSMPISSFKKMIKSKLSYLNAKVCLSIFCKNVNTYLYVNLDVVGLPDTNDIEEVIDEILYEYKYL